MLDYKKTEDIERMKAEAVKRLKWPKIPGLNEAFAKGIVMVSDGTNGDVKLRNLTIYEKYMALPIDKGLLCLEYGDIADPYFCYPVNAKPIGFEGCILYCFLPEYGEMVFACNPESCVDQNVYPLAANFEDFIRLILACGTANPLEQIVWMDKNKFEEHMANEEKILTDEQRTAAQQLQRALSLLPIENPFEYVKSIQKDFDGSKIQYSDEYYEVTGIENPKGTTPDKHLVEFEPVVFEINCKYDRN